MKLPDGRRGCDFGPKAFAGDPAETEAASLRRIARQDIVAA
jgi:hypothetical protein